MSRVDAETTLNEAEQVSCRFAMRTDMGLRRTENQDTYGYVRSRLSSLFIVADGMGGARGGATASAIAVDVVCREVSRQPLTEATLKLAIERANRAIFDRSRDDENLQGMGTTFVALALIGNRGFLAHVGDSRAYLLRDGALTKLTRDHTLIQELLETGAISDDQAENHPIAHMLTRSLGPARAVEVEFSPLPGLLKRGDRFLLCCDGLYNMVSDEEIAKILAGDSLDGVAQKLVDQANAGGGTDNITVEVIDVCPVNEGQSDLALDELEFFTSSDLDLSDLNLEVVAAATADSAVPDSPTNGHNGSANGEISAGSDKEKENRSTKKSSIDSIIFGDMPTDQDIREHHESVRQSSSSQSSETERSPGTEPTEGEANSDIEKDATTAAEDVEADRIVETQEIKLDLESAEVSEREAKHLRRIQYGAIAAVAVAVFAAAMVLIPARKPVTTVEPVATAPVDSTPTSTPPTEIAVVEQPAVPAVAVTQDIPPPVLAAPAVEVASLESPFALPEQMPMIAPPEASSSPIVEASSEAMSSVAVLPEPTPVNTAANTIDTIPVNTGAETVVTQPEVKPEPELKPEPDLKPEPKIDVPEPLVIKEPIREPTNLQPVEIAKLATTDVKPEGSEANKVDKVEQSKVEAWPEAKVTTSTTEAKLQALAVPTTAQKDDPNLTPYIAKEADAAVARVIAEAGDLAVPTPPVVKDPNLSDTPDQPIVWEHEQMALQKVLTSPEIGVSSAASEVKTQDGKTTETLESTDEEKKNLYQKKNELRDKISAIDARIHAFGLRTLDEAKKQLAKFDGELDVIDRALEQVGKNIDIAKRRYQVWMNRKDFLITGAEPFKLTDEVATNSDLVKRKKEAHDVTSVRYLDSVERWRANPSDNAATQNMTTLGRELRERRAELEEAIIKTVDSSLDQVISDLAEFGTTKSNLEKQRDRVNRQMGFIKAYNVNAKDNRLERQRKLMDERRQLTTELEGLRSKMPDQDEVIYRRSLIVSQYALPK